MTSTRSALTIRILSLIIRRGAALVLARMRLSRLSQRTSLSLLRQWESSLAILARDYALKTAIAKPLTACRDVMVAVASTARQAQDIIRDIPQNLNLATAVSSALNALREHSPKRNATRSARAQGHHHSASMLNQRMNAMTRLPAINAKLSSNVLQEPQRTPVLKDAISARNTRRFLTGLTACSARQ